MKEMVKRVREEKGGFTLAELLIVVAILLVLIAIAVPVFSGALGNADEAVDQANQRSAKSEALTNYMLAKDDAAKTAATTQYFYYDEKGNEIGDHTSTVPSGVKYGYKVTITVSDKGEITETKVDEYKTTA